MKIAYATTFDANDVHNWSGTPYYMSHAFRANGCQVDFIGSLKRKSPPFFKLTQTFHKYLRAQRVSPRFNVSIAKAYSKQALAKLQNMQSEVILAPQVNPIAFLDTKLPIVLWTDAVYSSLIGFYPPFSYHSAKTIQAGNEMTLACLKRASLAIFSSEWAANSAINLYGIAENKVKVVPFGANIQSAPSYDEAKEIVKKRTGKTIKLLFLAKSWERKGGELVLQVAKALHEANYPVSLTILGVTPPKEHFPLPLYVKNVGFISKKSDEGLKQFNEILQENHFLFVPSTAEAYGIVFCEANAHGLPCITTPIGGIGTVVKDNINGMKFGLDSSLQVYCDYIVKHFHDRQGYEALALSSFNEYQTRLNWNVAVQRVKELMRCI